MKRALELAELVTRNLLRGLLTAMPAVTPTDSQPPQPSDRPAPPFPGRPHS